MSATGVRKAATKILEGLDKGVLGARVDSGNCVYRKRLDDGSCKFCGLGYLLPPEALDVLEATGKLGASAYALYSALPDVMEKLDMSCEEVSAIQRAHDSWATRDSSIETFRYFLNSAQRF